jgi:anaerobic selenocysteine-containing dehydrogenase
MKVRRRDFLKTAGTAGFGLTFFNPVISAFDKSTFAAPPFNPVGDWIPTTCQGCTTWCPMEVFVQNGRVVKTRGNQNSQINTHVCPRGHMLPKIVYDPDRLKVPMKRTNPMKGKGVNPNFVPITWDEALDTIADKIMELRNNNETHKYLFLRGRYSYSRDLMYDRMTKIIGSPNNISHSAICAEAEKAGPFFTQGYWDYRDYDLNNTNYVLLWGVDPLRSNRLVPGSIKRFGDLLDYAKVVTIDPQLTTAASKSHEWLPVLPGQDGALASALAHHILVSGVWKKSFVGDFNDGINKFQAGQIVSEDDFTEIYTGGLVKWWNIELNDKTPEWAEPITGISADKIRQIAEEMGAAAPKVIVWLGPGPVMATRGTYTSMAIHALNGLVGSVDSEGGVLQSVKQAAANFPAPDDYIDDIAAAGKSMSKIDQRGTLAFPSLKKGKSGGGVVTNNTANGMLAADPYDIKMAIASWNNFAFSCSQPQRWEEALSNLPFFVHLTTHASEMTQFADIVLPVKNPFVEKWSYVKTKGFLYSAITIQQPMINPVFDIYTDENEVPWLIANKLAEKGFTNLLDYYTNEIKDPETGASPTTPEELALYATKFATKPAYDQIGGWDEFVAKGVVNFGPYTYESHWDDFATETGKFEFYSETLKVALQKHADKHLTTIDNVLQVCNYEALGELAFVPHYEAPYRWGSEADYPFDFIDTKSRLNREGRSQNLAWYYEFLKVDPNGVSHEDYLRINPVDAASLGIADGALVKVSSVTGSFESKVKLWEGIRPGTVTKTYGQGHWAYGRLASKDYATAEARGGNNNYLLPDDYDRLSGSTARNGGFVGVKIEPL